jgi:NADH-quinone oxidoreductase subunit N
MPDLVPVLPEMFVLGMACLVLLVDVFAANDGRGVSYGLAQLTLVGALALTLWVDGDVRQVTFGGAFVSDELATVLKVFIYIITFAAFLYSREYLRERDLLKGEYYVIGLLGVLGMMVMVSAHSLLVVYLGLELLSLALYSLVAFSRDDGAASEAAMKYFVLGALASGMLLYGMSMLYGVTGSLNISAIAGYVGAGASQGLLTFGLIFVVAGIAFKLGAVPFHMWIPDIYQGAPTPVTLFVGSAPKLAAFAMAMRLLVDGLGGLQPEWSVILIVLAVLSLVAGNVIAIAQSNIKRMLAYSTIAHIGFLVLGLLAGTPVGYSAAMFYAITYAFMAAGAFGVVILLSRKGFEAENLNDFKGLNDRDPWFAFMMLLIMFSMAGVPPTVGFYAKIAVLKAVVDAGLVWLAAVAVVFSIVGLFYYLRVVKLMYFDRAEDLSRIQARADMHAVLSANGLLMLALGIFPAGLMAVCAKAVG